MEEIEKPLLKLAALPFIYKLHCFDSIDSTNTFAKGLTDFSDTGLTIIVAKLQTAGRGQRGNSFFSKAQGGIFATIVCPIPTIENHFFYNRAISLAIFDSIKAIFPFAPLAIKWPNDIYWGNKKLCGILLESVPFSQKHFSLGFGINVNLRCEQFPPDIQDIATSVQIETGKTVDLDNLLCEIIKRFQVIQSLPISQSHEIYEKQLYRIGSLIEIDGKQGRLSGVEPDGRLVIESSQGIEFCVSGIVRFLEHP